MSVEVSFDRYRSARTAAAPFCAYAAAVGFLLGRKPLWLDEILQLSATRDGSLADVFRWAARNPGGVPFGYVTQWAAIRAFGYSVEAARLPAALFGLMSCGLVAILARQLRIRQPAIAALLLAILPLHFRYTLEARPYSQALFFSLLATAWVIKLSRRSGSGWWLAYALALAAGLYTQPYSFFVVAGHFVWAVSRRSLFGSLLAFRILAAASFALALFLPWFAGACSQWSESVRDAGPPFEFSAKAFLLIAREFCGGYPGAIAMSVAVCAGLASARVDRSTKILLLASIVAEILLAIAADAMFGYFLAVRQFICAAPAVVLLGAEGLTGLCKRDSRLGAALSAALVLLMAAGSFRLCSRQPEDWKSAAGALRAQPDVSCLAVIPREAIALYRFFEPALPSCGATPEARDAVALVLTPYSSRESAGRLAARLLASGFAEHGTRDVGGTRIRIFRNCARTSLAP